MLGYLVMGGVVTTKILCLSEIVQFDTGCTAFLHLIAIGAQDLPAWELRVWKCERDSP